jgi:FkbM family methyltransferase
MLSKTLRHLRYKVFYGLLLNRRFSLVTLGDQSYGVQWTLCPAGLNHNSVVYSGGVGEDISFEHALAKNYGCNVVLLDPSPTGLKTMARPENQIPQFRFLPLALAARSGKLKLAPPPEGGISWSAWNEGAQTLEVECTDLQSLMQKNGHTHIDLLKLDIEGCEYEVIDDLLKRRIPVRQICADFDYGYVPGVRRSQAIRSILKLIARGYKLVFQEGCNHTFVLGAPA